MAVSVQVRFAPGDEQRLLKLLDPKRYAWAMKDSLNRTAGNVATFGVKKVAKEMGIPETKLKKRGRYTRGSARLLGGVSKGRNASTRHLETSVNGYGRPFNAVRFGGQSLGPGAGVMHSSWGRLQFNAHAWQLNVSGRPLVLRKGSKVTGLYGPGVTHVMTYPHIADSMERYTQRRFRFHWRSRLSFAFSTNRLPGARGR